MRERIPPDTAKLYYTAPDHCILAWHTEYVTAIMSNKARLYTHDGLEYTTAEIKRRQLKGTAANETI